MEIKVKVQPVEKMRYPTVGDYYYDKKGVLQFRIADLGNDDMNFLVLLHEMIEEHTTKKAGITEQQIMDFDLMFEDERARGIHTDDEEPGWDERCIYREHHAFAEEIERMVCKRLGVDWDVYNSKVMSL